MEGGVQVPRAGSARMSGSGSGRLGGLARWRPRFFRRRAMRRDMSGTSRFSLRSSHSSHALFPDEVYENGNNGRPVQMRKTLSGLSSGFLLLDRCNSKHRTGGGDIPADIPASSSPTTSSTVTDAPSPCNTNTNIHTINMSNDENDNHDNGNNDAENDRDASNLNIADIDSQHRRSFRRTKGTLNLHDYKPDILRNNHHHHHHHHYHRNRPGNFQRAASTGNTYTDTGDDESSTLAPRPSFRKVLSGVLGRLR